MRMVLEKAGHNTYFAAEHCHAPQFWQNRYYVPVVPIVGAAGGEALRRSVFRKGDMVLKQMMTQETHGATREIGSSS